MKPTRASSFWDGFLTTGLILITFAGIYWRSLSFVYIEGDDASTVAYHAAGRNSQLQPHYATYEFMFDAILSILPPREYTIRVISMGLTALCAPLLFYFMLLLAFDWCGDIATIPRWPAAVAMLMAVPEIFYLAMVLTPSILAMTFLTGAHLVIRRVTADRASRSWLRFSMSVLLFGVGASFRWDTVSYGGTIVADLLLRSGDRSEQGLRLLKDRIRIAVLWGTLAGTAWVAAVMFSGAGPRTILDTLRYAGPSEPLSVKTFVALSQPLFTPGFLVLGALGFFHTLRRHDALPFVTIVSILPVAKLMLLGVPKWFITAIPSLFACAVAGCFLLWHHAKCSKYRYVILVLLALPWLVGVRMVFAGSAWGPAFELQRYDRTPTRNSRPSLAFGAGTAVPTPEGPRPLFGHAWVLFGNWRRFVVEADAEQTTAIRKAIRLDVPLLQDAGQALALVAYAALGLTTTDSKSHNLDRGFVVERRFSGKLTTLARMLQLRDRNQLFLVSCTERLRRVAGDTVIIHGYSSTLIRLYAFAPESLEPIGKSSAILHLEKVERHDETPSCP